MIATRPLPTCTAPKPAKPCCFFCEGCGGGYGDYGPIACAYCSGSGVGSWVAPVAFRLDPTHTFAWREAEYDPNTRTLTVWQARTDTARRYPKRYTVAEFECDWKGRAFRVTKTVDGTAYDLYLGYDGSVRCDCKGSESGANARANQASYERGEPVYPSYGCGHADSMIPLVQAGWFDLDTCT